MDYRTFVRARIDPKRNSGMKSDDSFQNRRRGQRGQYSERGQRAQRTRREYGQNAQHDQRAYGKREYGERAQREYGQDAQHAQREYGQHSRRAQREPAPREQSQRRSRTGSSTRGRRAVGATSISAPGANALGLSRRQAPRAYGRGETVRHVEETRREYQEDYQARPAVYTAEPQKQSLRSRIQLPTLRMPSISARAIPVWVVVLLAIAIASAIVMVPVRNYYLAWREAGVLQAQYEVVAAQNEELNHDIDRLQTLEGIEDEARERGYVYPDEEALVVKGVEEGIVADPALVEEALEEYEKSLPWYVGVFDKLFGYTRE